MKTNQPKWTPRQQLAIGTLDRDCLVTASAGTGKTAVLSQRCVNILSDLNDRTDVSAILVLTFTEAAAEEMLSRIASQLRPACNESNSAWLRRQMLLLDAADISTIDSFCKRLVTDNFHMLGIDPTFRIIDPDEQKLLKSDLLDQTIEAAWNDPQLCDALSLLLSQRNVQSSGKEFLKTILAASQFLDSIPSRRHWHANAADLANVADVFATDLAQRQKEIILKKLTRCADQLQYALDLDRQLADGYWADWINDSYLITINSGINLINADNDKYLDIIRDFEPPRFKSKSKELDKDISDLIKAPIDDVKDSLKALKDLALINPRYDQIVSPAVGIQTTVMLELIKRFDLAYAKAKKRLNCLDFADLEHLALKLLADCPDIAQTLQSRYRYIFVDEYQDTNALQQAILTKLASGDNTFVVGDIKQSIYAFRQAQPTIFLDRLANATDDSADKSKPLRVDLVDNFRSRKGVLDFANAVFKNIMTATTATIDYDHRAMLKAGFPYKSFDETTPSVELNIIDDTPSDDPSDSTVTTAQRQAAFIADRIKEMLGADTGDPQFQIYDKGADTYRNPGYSDIVILMRSPSGSVGQFIEVLRLAGIPVSSQSSAGYFTATEIADIVALLKVLDNPHRDIALAAVLRSPLFSITETQLAQIRLHGNSQSPKSPPAFYNCLVEYSRTGRDDPLRTCIENILERLDQWRSLARRFSLAETIWQIYRQTDYLSFVTALPNGSQRRSNLLKLHDRAIQFETFTTNSRSTSLTRFVEFIEKLLEQEQDWAPAQPENETEDAVRIMSVHASKGLEFPIVFLADLQKLFNIKDRTGDCLIDSQSAIGLRIVEPNSRARLSSIAHQVIAENKHETMLAEEMRILYVAITRARERLILVGSKKISACEKIVQPASFVGLTPLPDFLLRTARSHLDWLLMALADTGQICELFNIEAGRSEDDEKLFTAVLNDQTVLNEKVQQLYEKQSVPQPVPTDAGSDANTLLQLKESLAWQYPAKAATALPAKTSVSRLTHPTDEFSTSDYSNAFTRMPKVLSDGSMKTRLPAQKLIGTATHLIIEKIDLAESPTIESLKQIAVSCVPEDIIDYIDYTSIVNFFDSGIGKLALDQQNIVHREWPFTYAFDAGQLDSDAKGENIIVQGIIDMLIETPQGLVIVDFKTDKVTAETVSDRAEKYKPQIQNYAKAASAILDVPTRSSYLYFLKPSIAVSID